MTEAGGVTTGDRARLRQAAVAVVAEGARWEPDDLAGMSYAQSMVALEEASAVKRHADASVSALAAHVRRLSERVPGGDEGMARKAGFSSATQLVATVTGSTEQEAKKLADAGEVLALDGASGSAPERQDGHLAPVTGPQLPVLAAALRAGEISADAAAMISRMAHRVHGRVPVDKLAAAEKRLVERAARLSSTRLARYVKYVEATLDPEKLELDERAREDARYLRMVDEADGMVRIDGRLDPLTAAPVKAVLDGIVKAAFRAKRERKDRGGVGAGPVDVRSAGQIRADGLAAIARHISGCDEGKVPGATTRIVVRMDYDQLQAEVEAAGFSLDDVPGDEGGASTGRGHGVATIEGVDQPVTAGALRRFAADAGIIPAVLGGSSEVLDLGREDRLFSPAQRIALTERDGGCASCGAPPSWTEAHHIRWWDKDSGPTDLDNGLLLCVACHKQIHRDNWGVRIIDHEVWFVPPPSIDPERRPRPGLTSQRRAFAGRSAPSSGAPPSAA